MANWVLPSLLTLSALLVAVSAMLFYRLTNGAAYISGDENFIRYIFEIFSLIAIVIGLPTIVIGVLLPYLFKLTENFVEIDEVNPGAMIGRLITVNTVGAILGSIIAGFILLELIGLWASITLIAVIYSLAAAWFSLISNQKIIIKTIPIITTLLLLTVINPLKLPVVKINSDNNETLLKVWEGADATVAVVEREGYIRTKLNNWYSLGGTGDMLTQQMQTHLPLLLHSNPKDVFYLGLGTGITAGTALDYNVEHVTVAELAPSVIRASEEFFSEHTNNLYDDPRVTVVAEDGRNVLRGSGDTYDLIISDLFIPWKAGTGTLYSVNHYAKAQQRLNTDGLYVQWLPLYQLTKDEFDIIARTMLEIFPMLTLWRGNFWGDKAVVALIGHQTMSEIDPSSPLVTTSKIALNDYLTNNSDIIPLFAHYITSLTVNDSRISAARLNTDSNSVIEYLAPINHRREKAGLAEWFVGEQLLNFIGPHLSKEVLARDPYLSNIDTAWYDVIHVGYYLQTSYVLRDQNNSDFEFAKSNYQSLLKQAASQIKVLNNN